jgi:hypothetical protein
VVERQYQTCAVGAGADGIKLKVIAADARSQKNQMRLGALLVSNGLLSLRKCSRLFSSSSVALSFILCPSSSEGVVTELRNAKATFDLLSPGAGVDRNIVRASAASGGAIVAELPKD